MARKIGALWLKQTKDGKKYMSGILEDLRGDIRIAVFKNDRKEKDTHPDYQIILSEERKEQTQSEPSHVTSEPEMRMEDIPF